MVPADVCEGRFARDLWAWITQGFALDAVVTFSSEASPFPDIDVCPLILFIQRSPPKEEFVWVTCHRPTYDALSRWMRTDGDAQSDDEVRIVRRSVREGLETGLSRPPRPRCTLGTKGYVLGDFVKVMRGIASGANDFFFLTAEQATALGIPRQYFVRAIGRTRDVTGDEVTDETIRELERKGRPTLLLSLEDDCAERFPEPIREYLRLGEQMGLPHRPLISTRNPWYKMERRPPPPFLFAYLGRRHLRFIRNTAGVVPLTCFLCIYPLDDYTDKLDLIWVLLNNKYVIDNLALVSKSYGQGALKVEPRAPERLPLPEDLVKALAL